MKKRKILFVMVMMVLWIGLIVGSSIVSYKLGNSNEEVIVEKEQVDVRTIAIVNLDEGIATDEKITNYANELIDYANENLVSTSLEDARNGVKSGKYAAYVIIPATFSENINSINGQTVESEIQFELYENLTSEAGLATVSNVYLLINDLNNNVSYMYVDSILNEFHIAQDSAEEVLNNGKAISDAVSEITPEDISTFVQLPSTEKINYSPSSVDYGSYLQKNSELISDINKEYSKAYSKSVKEKDSLTTAADDLEENISATNNKLKDINVETDENGNYVYDAELTDLSASLSNYNNNLNASMKEITTNMQDVSGGLTTYTAKLTTLSNHYSATLERYNNETITNLNRLNEELTTGSYVLNLGKSSIQGYKETEGEPTTKSVKINYSDNDSKVYRLIDEDGNIDTSNLYNIINDIVEKGYVGYKTESDVNIRDSSKMMKILKSTIPQINAEDAYYKDESGNYNKLDGSITSEIEEITSGLNSLSGTVETLKNSEIEEIDSTAIVEDVKGNVVDKLSENVKNITDSIASEYDGQAEALSSFSTNLTAYDPHEYINQKTIQQKSSELNSSTLELEKVLNAKDAKDMEALNNAFVKYGENIDLLKDSITAAVDSANNTVEQGLQNAKETLSAKNSRNTTLLESFSEKLLYTRNGSIGNYKTYNFIVNPCEIVNVGKEKSATVAEEVAAKDDGINTIQIPLIYVIGILGMLVIGNAIILTALYKKQKKDNYNL